MNRAKTALDSTTQRQPEIPSGAWGTSHQDSNATAGTERNWRAKAKANAEVRMALGTSSDR